MDANIDRPYTRIIEHFSNIVGRGQDNGPRTTQGQTCSTMDILVFVTGSRQLASLFVSRQRSVGLRLCVFAIPRNLGTLEPDLATPKYHPRAGFGDTYVSILEPDWRHQYQPRRDQA